MSSTVSESRVLQRDNRGRFAKKETIASVNHEAIKIESAEVKPTLISSAELLKLFDRSTGRPLKGEVVFLKATSLTVPNVVEAGSSRVVRFSFTLETKYLCAHAAANYGYLFLQYDTLNGDSSSDYFPSDYQFELVDKSHSEYDKLSKDYDKVIVKTLSNRLNHNFFIGSDPEIFVEDREGKLIPAFKFLPGKDKPALTANQEYLFNTFGGCPMYWDGYQAEFTTRPARCLGHHGDSIAAGMRGVYDAAKNSFPDAKLSLRSVFNLDPKELATAEEEHVSFGCMPSKNAYGLKVEMPPPRMVPFRSAGGHIHFGVGELWHPHAEKIVKALDAVLGVACVSLFAEFDNPNRRRLYGLPGEYRTPKHGIEYRPLSNAWLCHPMIMNLVFDLARKCVMFGQKDYMKFWDATEEETIECIVNCDVEAAHKILKRNKVIFKSILNASYHKENKLIELLYDLFINGISSAINNPHDFVTNWRLHTGWIYHRGAMNEPNVSTFMRNRIANPAYKM